MDVKISRDRKVSDGLDALIVGGKLIGKIGWTATDLHEDPITKTRQQVATTALKNEFGFTSQLNDKDVHVPARPFLRNTIRREYANWFHTMERGAQFVLDNQITFDTVLESVTTEAVQDVRDTVQNRMIPPLSPITLRLRLLRSVLRRTGNLASGTLPLYETGHMMQTLTNEVIEG